MSEENDPTQFETQIAENVIGVEPEPLDETLRIDRPFDPSKIRVTTERKNIDLIVRRIAHQEIDLAPEFQRRARVWHIQRKSQLIESLLLRIPLPVFYVAADEFDNWSVVDGLQRLTTIHDFISGEFRLSGLEYLGAIDGKSFKELDRAMQRRIEETELVINVIQPGTPEEVMINIFKRLNTGGVPLTGQEIRNALNKGPVREFLRLLAEHDDFISATTGSVRDDRMDAQEMTLRFLAFRMTPPDEYKVNDLDTFLNEAMRRINAMPNADREVLGRDFARSMRAAKEIFDRNAFRKPRLDENGVALSDRNPVSKPLFEAWSVSLSKLDDVSLAILYARKEQVIRRFHQLMKSDSEFVIAISYSTGVPKRVAKRFDEISSLLKAVLAEPA